MVRRGSTVRVRQRACRKDLQIGILCCLLWHVLHARVRDGYTFGHWRAFADTRDLWRRLARRSVPAMELRDPRISLHAGTIRCGVGQEHEPLPPERVSRRGRDPPASGGSGFSAARRGRELPGPAGEARGWARSARRHRGLPRQVRHAVRRRDRHHEAALERTPHHARAPDPRQHQEIRAGRRPAELRAGAAGGLEEGTGAA